MPDVPNFDDWVKTHRPSTRGLDPQFQSHVDEILKSLQSRGLNARLTEGYRSPEKQDEYFAQGRTKPGRIVTGATGRTGKHPRGIAADIDLLDPSGRPLADNDPAWSAIGEEASRRGLTWGGNWKMRDMRHVELGQSPRKRPPKFDQWTPESGIPKFDDWSKDSGQIPPPSKKSETLTPVNRSSLVTPARAKSVPKTTPQLFDPTVPKVADMIGPSRPATFAEDRAQRVQDQKVMDILKGRAGAAANFSGSEYANFLNLNRSLDSPNMRDQYLTLKAKQAIEATGSGSPYRALTAQNREAERQQRVSKMSTGQKAAQLPKSLATGLTSAGGELLKGSAVAGRAIVDRITDTRGFDTREAIPYRLGEYIQTRVPELLQSNPDLEQEFFVGKAPQAVGQSISFLLGGLATKAPRTAVTILGAGMSAGSAYGEVKAAGGTEDQAVNAGLLAGAILGPSELLGMRGAMKAISGTAKEATIKAALKTAMREGRRDVIENALQEAGQEFGQGLITGQRRSPEQLAEAALLGGLASGIVTPGATLATQVGGRRATQAQGQPTPNIGSTPEAITPPRREVSPAATDAQAGTGPEILRDAEAGGRAPEPQRFYHKDFGEVEILPDQTGAGRSRYRVAEVADPTKQHFVKKSQLTGRGNERMVPLKTGPQIAEPQGLTETLQESRRNITETITKPDLKVSPPNQPAASPESSPAEVGSAASTPDLIAKNQAVLDSPEFRERLLSESVSGNAGEDRAAVNAAVDREGKIVHLGNIQDFPPEIRGKLASGEYQSVSFIVRNVLTKPEIERVIPHGTRSATPTQGSVQSEWYADFEDPSKSTGTIPPDIQRIAETRARASTKPAARTGDEIDRARNAFGQEHLVSKYLKDHPLRAKVLAELPEGSTLAGPNAEAPEMQSGPIRLRAPNGEIWEVDDAYGHRRHADWKTIGTWDNGFAVRKTGETVPDLSKPANKISTKTTKRAERTAYGQSTNTSMSQFVRRSGGIEWTENDKGELARLSRKDLGDQGAFLVSKRARQGNVKQTADIMMQKVNEAGYRDPDTGQPFDNPGNFLRALEADASGIRKIYVRTGEASYDFSAAELEYYAEQEARLRAEEARDNFLESGRGAELFDRIVDREASDAERQEYIELAERAGISRAESEDLIADARAEIEALQGDGSEGTPAPSRPAEQLGFVQEGLTQQVPSLPQRGTDQRERLIREEQARQASVNPERTTVLAKLEEIKRRGMTVDDYARQPDLMGNVPGEAEITSLRELESARAREVDRPQQEYDAALDEFRAVSRRHTEAAKRYRAREIGDDEYLAVRREFDDAQAKMDETERRFSETEGQEGLNFGPGTMRAGEPDATTKALAEAGKSGFDEQIEERHGGFPIGRALFGERPRLDTLGPKSVNPEAEARMKAAEGIQPPSVIRRAREGLASVYHSFKRTFPEINPNKDDVSAVVNDHLRQLLAAPNYAKAVAFDKIAEITQNLGKERLRVFSRNLILPDILKDMDAGLYDSKPLPFGYKDRTQIETDLAKFQEAAEGTPAIKDALERRQGFTKALTEKLVSLDLLPKEVLSDPRYYHRQVMEYVNNPAWVGTGSGDARLHRKGFQRGRVGGGDFNTRYQEAEFEWSAQALSLIARKETLARIQHIADIRPALDLEAKLWNDAHPENPKTWQAFVPETHRAWQPVKGSHFYPTLSITERTMDQILEGSKPFEESDVREILALGGKRQQWVVPEEIAKTLDEFRPYRDEGPIANVWTQAQSSWKQWVLLNPIRVLKYNLNNISGDLDITLAYNPKILKQAPRAARELWNYQVKGTGSAKAKAEVQDAIKRGVVDSGLTIVEIPDINKEGAFRGLTSKDPNVIQGMVQRYWGGVKTFTTWRENTLRLAAYRHFQERIAKGEPVYAASTKKQIDAIKDPNDKAAKLARELVGDYGAVSHAGQWIRRHLIPFYSWIEINTPRYARLMRNLPHEGKSPAKAAAMRVLTGAPKLAAKASLLYVAAQLWNHAMFPDEEKELRTASRTPHLILGRNEDGSIRVLRVEGALADALEWFAAEDLPYDVADIAKGKKGAGPKAKLAEAVKAPVERFVQSFEPFSKTLFETASGRTAYPSLFEKGESFKIRPRVIRDRKENIARVLSLDSLYRRVTGRPSPPSNGPLNAIVNGVLTYRVDPGEAAYWDFRGKAFDWTKAQGKESGAADPTARSNALYYYKQALKWHDEKAAKKWLAQYHRLGGSDKGMAQSLRMGHPLGSIKKDDQAEFLNSLTDEERATLELAEKWYTKTYGEIQTGPSKPMRPPAPPKPEAPARP